MYVPHRSEPSQPSGPIVPVATRSKRFHVVPEPDEKFGLVLFVASKDGKFICVPYNCYGLFTFQKLNLHLSCLSVPLRERYRF